MKVIGLTGNIGCGKSTVLNILSKKGIPTVDADQISRELCVKGSATLKKIKLEFGVNILTKQGELNRRYLRNIIFKDEKKRKNLEKILHPEIRKRSFEKIKALKRAGHPLIIYEATLIIEAHQAHDFDGILLVTCSLKNQKKYLKRRDEALSTAMLQQILKAQMPQEKKERFAHWVIKNNGTVDELKEKVTRWLENL